MFLATLLVVAFASHSFAAPVNDQYANLIQDVLLWVKQEMTDHDPIILPDMNDQNIKDVDVDLFLTQTNSKLAKASTLAVDEVTTDPIQKTAHIQMTIPQLLQTGQYSMSGTAYGRKISGSGDVTVTISKMSQTVDVTLSDPDTNLQLSTLNIGYDIGSIDVDITGLTIEGMTPAQIKVFVTKTLTNELLKDKARVQALISTVVQSRINEIIAFRTLDEVDEWVKSLIHQ